MAKDLILEIGTEELPPRAVDIGIEELKEKAKVYLQGKRLSYVSLESWGTPRRLVLKVSGLKERQEEAISEIKGPPKYVAYTESGEPTSATIGFARSCGVSLKDLKVKTLPQGTYVYAVKREKGKPTSKVLKETLKELIVSLNFPKAMYWGEKEKEKKIYFPRPIRWLLALYGDETISFKLGNLKASNITYGHRVLNKNPFIRLKKASDYPSVMKKSKVIFDQNERRRLIEEGIKKLAKERSAIPIIDPAVLSQAVQLTEYPTFFTANFPEEFLSLPNEVITAVMDHQYYFPLKDRRGRLKSEFVVIHNGDERFTPIIREGHKRVLNARLTDARFFYEEDAKVLLEKFVERLKGVIFHEKLGTLYDKTERVKKLSKKIGSMLKLDKNTTEKVLRAAHLSKADLVTQMVVEFPELQGVMGKEYALLSGEDEEVAVALSEQYLPSGMKGELPKTITGKILSIADKLDTIFSCLCVGLIPSGSEDPYALRREAISALRIILESKLRISLKEIIESSLEELKRGGSEVLPTEEAEVMIENLLKERLTAYLQRRDKVSQDIIEAVFSVTPLDDVVIIRKKAKAIKGSDKKLLEDILTAFTRCKNLADPSAGKRIKESFLQESEEKKLYEVVLNLEKETEKALKEEDFKKVLYLLSKFKPEVDNFFDKVLVMAEDRALRRNRLALLNRSLGVFLKLADFSKIVG